MTLVSQYKNFSAGKLLAGITAVSTSCTLQSGQGSNFPTANGTSTSFLVVLIKSTGEREICVCKRTAGSDVITFIDVTTGNASVNGRAQEGTSALVFSAADQVELRLTAAQIQSFEDDIDTLQTSVTAISGDYLTSDHNPGGADEDDHDTRYYTQAQLYTQTEVDTNKPDFTDIWTRAQLAAAGGGAPIDAEHLTGKDAISHSQITDNQATKHRLINDSAGNGDTTELWSANKIYDQLALKTDIGHAHSRDFGSVTVFSGWQYTDASGVDDSSRGRMGFFQGVNQVCGAGNCTANNTSFTPTRGPALVCWLSNQHVTYQVACQVGNYLGSTSHIHARIVISDFSTKNLSTQGTVREAGSNWNLTGITTGQWMVWESPTGSMTIPSDGYYQVQLQFYGGGGATLIGIPGFFFTAYPSQVD